MSASLLRTTATRTPSALTPKDRFRADADLVTKAMVLNVFVSCFCVATFHSTFLGINCFQSCYLNTSAKTLRSYKLLSSNSNLFDKEN